MARKDQQQPRRNRRLSRLKSETEGQVKQEIHGLSPPLETLFNSRNNFRLSASGGLDVRIHRDSGEGRAFDGFTSTVIWTAAGLERETRNAIELEQIHRAIDLWYNNVTGGEYSLSNVSIMISRLAAALGYTDRLPVFEAVIRHFDLPVATRELLEKFVDARTKNFRDARWSNEERLQIANALVNNYKRLRERGFADFEPDDPKLVREAQSLARARYRKLEV